MDFDSIFKHVAKKTAKDANADLHKAGDISIRSYVPFGILTGLPMLDLSIGRPGWPAGRCIELYGFEASGKTTAALHALAQAQRVGGGGMYIDTEQTWDEPRARDIGVNPDVNFAPVSVKSVDAAFRVTQAILEGRKKTGDYSKPFVIIIDSITGSANEYTKSREIGEEERIGQDARVIRGGMRRIIADVAETKINLFMVNHAISKVAVFKFSKTSQAAGGHAIKLLSTVRCEFKAIGRIKDPFDKERVIGQKVRIEIEKLKGSRLEWPIVNANLMGDIGFDTEESLLEAGIRVGFVKHEPGSKDYSFGEKGFPKTDWPHIVAENGGVDKFYDTFIKWALDNEKLKRWGT